MSYHTCLLRRMRPFQSPGHGGLHTKPSRSIHQLITSITAPYPEKNQRFPLLYGTSRHSRRLRMHDHLEGENSCASICSLMVQNTYEKSIETRGGGFKNNLPRLSPDNYHPQLGRRYGNLLINAQDDWMWLLPNYEYGTVKMMPEPLSADRAAWSGRQDDDAQAKGMAGSMLGGCPWRNAPRMRCGRHY